MNKKAIILIIIFSVILLGIIGFNMTRQNQNTRIKLETNHGDIVIELYKEMPITAGNFEKLVSEGFYDKTIFHRVIDGFMIQGGDPAGTGMGGPGNDMKEEFR